MAYFVGVDIGTTSTKVAIIDESGKLLDHLVMLSGADFKKSAEDAFDQLLNRNGIKESEVEYIVSTGYGRRLVNFADESISEISANAKGASTIGKQYGVEIRTIIDIGGQDSKVISLDANGKVNNFTMNDKCAAGTGRFLESMARVLEVNISNFGELLLKSQKTVTINSTCTVFAETEVISHLARGQKKEDIVAGIHRSIVQRVMALGKRVGIKEVVFLSGGPARNEGLVKTMKEMLNQEVFVPPHPQVVTAFGAATIARERADE